MGLRPLVWACGFIPTELRQPVVREWGRLFVAGVPPLASPGASPKQPKLASWRRGHPGVGRVAFLAFFFFFVYFLPHHQQAFRRRLWYFRFLAHVPASNAVLYMYTALCPWTDHVNLLPCNTFIDACILTLRAYASSGSFRRARLLFSIFLSGIERQTHCM